MEVNKKHFGGSDRFNLVDQWNADEAARLPARTLAYIGDAVYELGLRLAHVRSGIDTAGRLHDSLVGHVNSSAQAKIFDMVFAELDETEQQMVKTWRNAKTPTRYGSGTRSEYARATALEAWVAWLFLTGQNERLHKLFELITGQVHETGQTE
ncbi:MAG: ribonuclease III [Candidatus Riflebacteria bacterium HGW-Riflebacteria-2]|nr:MAG: ribonuclease III [Candidatus Riflebacteria bacterium HGW-Riflebacteria-2]